MPILENERHELFAQQLAQGKSASEAYVLAGFKPSRKNASRLRAREDIGARVAELQLAGAKSAEISVQSLISELEEARSKATSLNQLSAAVRATAEKAKISGLLTQKVELEVSQAEANSFPPPFWVESDFPRFVSWTLEDCRQRYGDNPKILAWTDAMADTMMQFYPHQTPAWRSPGSQRRRQRQVIDGVAQRVIGNGKE